MIIQKMKLKDIKEASYNPRQISKFMREKLIQSIKEFGCVQPLILNKRSGQLIGGHQRLNVLKELYGPEYEVDVVQLDLDENKEKALNLSLNRVSGEWVEDKLINVLKEIEEVLPPALQVQRGDRTKKAMTTIMPPNMVRGRT